MTTTLHGAAGNFPRGYVEVAANTWAWLEPNGPMARDSDFGRFRDWLQPERLALNVLARHRELHGAGPAKHDPVSRSQMFSEVAELDRYLGRIHQLSEN